jgi:hypothetical protein
MGLSISRSLIEVYGGTLYFNSEFGKGSTFYFTLPIETAERDNLLNFLMFLLILNITTWFRFSVAVMGYYPAVHCK